MIDGKQYVSVAVGWGGVYGPRSARDRASGAGHRLHLRGRRHGARCRTSRKYHMEQAAAGREVRPGRGAAPGTLLYVSNCVVLPRRAGRGPGRQHPRTSAYADAAYDRATSTTIVFRGARAMARGMPELHRQAQRPTTSTSIKAFIQGVADRSKDPAPPTEPREGRAYTRAAAAGTASLVAYDSLRPFSQWIPLSSLGRRLVAGDRLRNARLGEPSASCTAAARTTPWSDDSVQTASVRPASPARLLRKRRKKPGNGSRPKPISRRSQPRQACSHPSRAAGKRSRRRPTRFDVVKGCWCVPRKAAKRQQASRRHGTARRRPTA